MVWNFLNEIAVFVQITIFVEIIEIESSSNPFKKIMQKDF